MQRLGIVLLMVLIVSCAPASQPPAPKATAAPTFAAFNIPAEKYLFIQYARVVEGSGRLPGLAVDFPQYQFDSATGEMKLAPLPVPPVKLGATQIGFFGATISRTGTAGSGTSSALTAIEATPFNTKAALFRDFVNNAEVYDNTDLVVKSIGTGASIQVEIGNESVTLKAGDKWEKVIEKEVTTPRGAGKLKITHTLTNFGLQDRAKIVQ